MERMRAGSRSGSSSDEDDAPPRRPRQPERTREKILQAAMAEFSTRGLGGARVDSIAQRAGVNKRMLYHYFGSKDDLFLAVMESTYESIRRLESELRLEDGEPLDAMRRLIKFTVG
jgi:AcrR family transcriptional regulator